jgi:Flp pilus assembly protein TadG
MSRNVQKQERRGAILVLTAFLMMFLLGMAAFAIDLGYVLTVQTEMQRCADAAASAAAWDLYESTMPGTLRNTSDEVASARTTAVSFAAANPVAAAAPAIDPNESNSASGDVLVGYLPNDNQTGGEMSYDVPSSYNAVRVTLQKSTARNGEIAFFFGRVFNQTSISSTASATAAFVNNFGGFAAPSDGGNLEILPFSLDEDTWNQLLTGVGEDNWKWDSDRQQVVSGNDGVLEMNLYPQGTGSPGNRGTVDIGNSNNSTSDLARQITGGISQDDLDYLGGSLKFDNQGTLTLNGDTGISAGIKDELASIIGQKRIIPVFQSVSGPGNNAQYVITKFVGVRVLEVELTGKMSSKRLMVQPANVLVRGGIPSSGPQKTYAMYSPVRLVH